LRLLASPLKCRGDPREFVRQLAAGGVEMSAHRNTMQRLLADIIQERIDARARNVAVPGWHDSSYVLPSGESYGSSEELLVYQHSGGLQHHYAAVSTRWVSPSTWCFLKRSTESYAQASTHGWLRARWWTPGGSSRAPMALRPRSCVSLAWAQSVCSSSTRARFTTARCNPTATPGR